MANTNDSSSRIKDIFARYKDCQPLSDDDIECMMQSLLSTYEILKLINAGNASLAYVNAFLSHVSIAQMNIKMNKKVNYQEPQK